MGEILSKTGFSKWYPGPGIIHQRQRSVSARQAEDPRNRELIFDLMDAYRPPFRYYLWHAFMGTVPDDAAPALQAWYREHTFQEQDFYSGKTGWERVWYVQPHREAQLEELFQLICQQPFPFGSGTTKPLIAVMGMELRLFANLLANKKHFRDAVRALDALLPWYYLLTIPSYKQFPTPVSRAAPFSTMGDLWLKYVNDQSLVAHVTAQYQLLALQEREITEGAIGKAPDPTLPASLPHLLTLLNVDPLFEEVLVSAGIRTVLQLALKRPYELVECGLALELARTLRTGAVEYVQASPYGSPTNHNSARNTSSSEKRDSNPRNRGD